tara:strand:- start:2442 stop:4115 length:1674 start_codon:yes stop_codon:yes gene_type:complete
MKKAYLLFFACVVFFASNAQNELSPDYNFSISKPYKVIDGTKEYFHNDNNIIAIKADKKYLYIQKFNGETLNEVSRTEYKLKDVFPGNFVKERIVQLQDRCYFFYSSWSGKKTKHERLYYREIDLNTGKLVGENIKLIDVAGKLAGSPTYTMSFGFGSYGVVDKFDFLVSNDESKLLINYRKKPEVKRDTKSHDIFGVNVFDLKLSEIWSNEYEMPYTERRMNVLDFAVDSNGKGFMLAKVFHDDSNENKKKKKDKEANYHIELFRFLKGDNSIQKTKIELDEKFINGIALFESNNSIVCSGFYNKGKDEKSGFFSKNSKGKNADGLFVFKISNDGELIDKISHEIPVDILNQYVSDKTKNRNEKEDKEDEAEFKSIKLKDVVIYDDGSIILIGEQNYVITHTFTSMNGGTRTTFTYYYNDMLISKIDPEGNLVWMKKLPKRQRGKQGLGGMSYSYFNTNGSHYLIFLDNVKNIDLPLNKIPALHSDGAGGYLTAYKINDSTGEINKDNIFDTRNVTKKLDVHQFSTNRVIKTAEDEFVIEFYKKKKEDVLIKVKIN